MLQRGWLRPVYRLLLMFFATTAVLASALAWMGWRLIRQERLLAGQRTEERRERAAEQAVAALKEALSITEAQLLRLSTVAPTELPAQSKVLAEDLPEDSALLVFSADPLQAFPPGRLLYYPDVPRVPADTPAALAAAEKSEFQERDYLKAADILQALVGHSDPAIRAAAQARLGRCLRKAGRIGEALAAFEELARAGAVSIAGLPAELVALESRLLILEEQRNDAARREASALDSALRGGKWRINRVVFEYYRDEAARILGSDLPAPSLGVSEAAEAMLPEWQEQARRESSPAGRRNLWCQDRPWLLFWRGSGARLVVLALGREYLEAKWLGPLKSTLASTHAEIMFSDIDGRPVAGDLPKGVPASVRMASATQLPWTLHTISVHIADPGFGAQRLIVTGLLTLLLLILAGGYFIGRAAAREVAVARLQSDFVASVSHEFRTPVTAMRQLSELLATGRVDGEEDRNQYYEALVRESERLHRLVEGLLTFGQMEAGALTFRFETLDPAQLASTVVAEFEREGASREHHIELRAEEILPSVRADRAALGCVLWNLLDNAVKYSPECPEVWFDVARDQGGVAFRVRDRGIGIPIGEQRDIFNKFVRGSAARERGFIGAGVGLAMARQIVAAHHGEIRIESRPGEGSTFTVLLPASNGTV
jgi:signal transduction histidine kinase